MSSIQSAPILDRFQHNLKVLCETAITLISKLNNAGHNEITPLAVNMALVYVSTADKLGLLENFVNCSHKEHWDRIKDKDGDFFIQNAGAIFTLASDSMVEFFKLTFTCKGDDGKLVIGEEDRELLWRVLGNLVKLSIKYIHERRDGVKAGNMDGVYRNSEYMREVELGKHVEKWGVVLEWK